MNWKTWLFKHSYWTYRFGFFLTRKWRAVHGGYPKWHRLGASKNNRAHESQGKRVLVATSVGAHLASATLESVIAESLLLRGATVDVILCDHALPICMDCEYRRFATDRLQHRLIAKGPGALCYDCYKPARRMYSELDVDVLRYGEFLNQEDFDRAKQDAANIDVRQIRDFRWNSITVGEHAYAGALRFYARGDLDGEALGESILRRYLEASLLTVFAIERLLSARQYEVAFFNHGIYVPQGLIGECCRKYGVRVVNWNAAYRKQCFIFSHGDTYHHTLMNEPVSDWENIKWSDRLSSKIEGYLRSRWEGINDWIWFHHKPTFDVEAISKGTGIDFSKPCIGLLTNVIWDAQLHYPANAFENMMEWIIDTIRYFKNRPDINLIIRVHPAELRGAIPSRQSTVDEIERVFARIPSNVFVIPPSSDASTYTLMSLCDSVLIYGTKTGVELTAAGIPVIVAGEAWIRGKGISKDVTSKSQYLTILDDLPLGARLERSLIERARKYAFHFFFRRMIPFSFMKRAKGWPPFTVDVQSVDQLRKGKNKALDIVCEAILNNRPFIYPEEEEIFDE